MNGNFIWFVSDQKEFKYQLSSSLDMTLLDFPIICKKKENMIEKDENVPHHQKLISQCSPKPEFTFIIRKTELK